MGSKEVYDDDGGIRGVDNDMDYTDMGYINNTCNAMFLCFTILWYFSKLILVIWFKCIVVCVILNLVIDAC